MIRKRITIFAGNYGSGKTELAINYALRLKSEGGQVVLADLDVVNPYFRSREKNEFLKEKGIEVIFPARLAKADLPVISADVKKIIQNKDLKGIFDVGGDDDGAVALGSVSRKLKKSDYEMSLVVNTMRPFTSKLDGIVKMKNMIEKNGKLSFDNIICNINLGRETKLEHIKKGYPLVKEASEKLDLPIKYLVVMKKLLPLPEDFIINEKIFPIDIFMKQPWEK